MRPKYFTVILLSFVFILNSNSFVFAATKRKNESEASINKVLHTAFLMRKSKMLSSLRKGMQKKDFTKGSFFKGEFPEFKNISGDLRKVDFHVDESPNGFSITVKKGKHKLKAEVEFIDFVERIVSVNNVKLKIGKNATYPQVVQSIGSIVLLPFAEKKSKKVGFNLFNWNWPLSSAYAVEESGPYSQYVYKRPEGIPKAYIPLWRRIIGKDQEALDEISKTTKGTNRISMVVGGVGAMGAAITGSYLAAVLAIPAVMVFFFALIAVSSFTTDFIHSVMSNLDDLEEAANGLNSVLSACEKGKKDYYKKGTNNKLTLDRQHMTKLKQLDTKMKNANFIERLLVPSQKNRLKRYSDFRTLWSASRSLSGKLKQNSKTEILCQRLPNRENFEKLGDKRKSFPGIEVPDDKVTVAGRNEAIRRLCNVYTGILKCFNSVPSPYGEQEEEDNQAAVYDYGRIEEVNEAFEDYYKSIPSKVLQ